MFHRNNSSSSRPMSAWNLSAENAQVGTPSARVTPVKAIEVPVVFSASKNAACSFRPWARNFSMRLYR
ncbi:hypothetical protein D3C80_2204390 [compost metagenome]